MWCDTRRLTRLHCQHQRLNNTSTSPPTAIKFLLKQESSKWRSQQLRPTMTLGWIGWVHLSHMSYSPTTASIRHCWYLKYLIWSLQLFVDCLVCSRYCLQLPCMFLECVMLHGACVCFWPLGLKNPLVWKRTLVRKPLSLPCVPSYLYMSAQVA
jgi:hypothetical protein